MCVFSIIPCVYCYHYPKVCVSLAASSSLPCTPSDHYPKAPLSLSKRMCVFSILLCVYCWHYPKAKSLHQHPKHPPVYTLLQSSKSILLRVPSYNHPNYTKYPPTIVQKRVSSSFSRARHQHDFDPPPQPRAKITPGHATGQAPPPVARNDEVALLARRCGQRLCTWHLT